MGSIPAGSTKKAVLFGAAFLRASDENRIGSRLQSKRFAIAKGKCYDALSAGRPVQTGIPAGSTKKASLRLFFFTVRESNLKVHGFAPPGR
ncbi:MAG TPA: hypothetical protein DIC18_00965, partial [Clostridiales bacterium]|nr:hypothetical protein [Clostridiales bacterium]